jgi:hypothetical protein
MEITHLLTPIYGRKNIEWDTDEFRWIMIQKFRLPKGWVNRRLDSPFYGTIYTPLLIEIPVGYPSVAPQNFYSEQQLQCGTDFISHYFDRPGTGTSQNKYTDKGWAWLCVHVLAWECKTNLTKGDTLLTICRIIFDILSDKSNARRNYYK